MSKLSKYPLIEPQTSNSFLVTSNDQQAARVSTPELINYLVAESGTKGVKTVDNVALMKARNYQLDDTVLTAGYYSPNDGGGALYRIVAGGTGTDDGGSYHDLDNGLQAELAPNRFVSLDQYGGVGDGVTDNLIAMTNWLNSGSDLVVPSKTYFSSAAVSVSTASPLTIIGNGKKSSKFLFSNTDGISIVQSDAEHFITIQGISIETNSVAIGTGLTVDGSSQVVANLIQPRDVQRGTFRDLFIGGKDTNSSFDNCIDFISFGWFNIDDIETRGLKPANQTTTAPLGTGILLRGNGQPVEMFITNFWQYYHGFAIRTPDSLEGLFLDKFNVVACDNGFIFGITDADSMGTQQPKTLGFTVSNGHINCRGEPMNFGELSNQAKVDNILLYIREGTFTNGDTTGLTMTNGGNNNVNDLTFIIVDDLVSRTSFTPIKLVGQNASSFSNINCTIGTSTQIVNTVDARTCQRCSFSNFTSTVTTGSFGSFFLTDNSTTNSYFHCVLNQGVTLSQVDNTADTNINTSNQNTYDIEYLLTSVVAVAGGAPSETINIPIPSWLLSRVSQDVTVTVLSKLAGLDLLSTYDQGAATTTNIPVIIATNNLTNLPAGNARLRVSVKVN